MPKRNVIKFMMLSILILPLSNAFAVELNAIIFAQKDVGFGTLKASHIAEIKYEGERLRTLMNIEKETEFTADMSVPGVKELVALINNKLVNEVGSPVQFKEITVHYKGRMFGEENNLVINVAIVIDFKLEKIVIGGNTFDENGALVDINWRGLTVKEPVIINAEGIGEIDINSIKGFIVKTEPQLASVLENTEIDNILKMPLLEFSDVKKLSINNWHASFDSTGAVADAEKYKLAADVPPVLTIYAKGESSLREGVLKETVINNEISVNGENIKLTMTIPPAYSTLKLAGYATIEIINNEEYLRVTDNPPAGKQIYQSQNLPLMVVGVFAGMAAIIAGIVIWKVNKKPSKV